MTRHSKRNTALSFFTAYERSLVAKYGVQHQRLTSASYRNLDSCHLCLTSAQNPVACPYRGHIFCRECALENILSQKSEIADVVAQKKISEEEQSNKKQKIEQVARKREIEQFEISQSSFSSDTNSESRAVESAERDKAESESRSAQLVVKKRSLYDPENSEIAAFWIPSKVPSLEQKKELSTKLKPVCPASSLEDIHAFSLKKLVSVNFTEELLDKEQPESIRRICPCCRKYLTYSLTGYLIVKCGHFVCSSCVDTLMMADIEHGVQCVVCETELKPQKKPSNNSNNKYSEFGMIFIDREGTSYVGGGVSVVTKKGINFQT